MKYCGHLYEVMQLAPFVQQYLVNGSRPAQDIIRPIQDAPVMLFRWDQAKSHPQLLVECNTDQFGWFDVDITVLPASSLFIVVSVRQGPLDRGAGDAQPMGCWYRSLPFIAGAINERPCDIYVARTIVPDKSGFSQAELATVLSETKKQAPDLEWIRGTITPGGITLSCGGKGAKASGRLVLNPDLSGDLSKILRHSIEDFRLELPGPSWLTGLVVSRDVIEAEIRAGLKDLASEINDRLRLRAIALFTDQVQAADPALAARLPDETTLSLGVLHYAPASGDGRSEGSRTIAGEAYLGFPRILEGRYSRT